MLYNVADTTPHSFAMSSAEGFTLALGRRVMMNMSAAAWDSCVLLLQGSPPLQTGHSRHLELRSCRARHNANPLQYKLHSACSLPALLSEVKQRLLASTAVRNRVVSPMESVLVRRQ